MRTLLCILIINLLFTNRKQDDLYLVTKRIEIQDTITIGKQFDFKLILRNDSAYKMKLTIDITFQKSLFFNSYFLCYENNMPSDVKNHQTQKHNYQNYFIKSGDSLVYHLKGKFRQVKDSLQMEIIGYDRVQKISETDCKNFRIMFGGIWKTVDSNPYDLEAKEGLSFYKQVFVKK
jgi:hypothetical protein